jgi:hypothetical protein
MKRMSLSSVGTPLIGAALVLAVLGFAALTLFATPVRAQDPPAAAAVPDVVYLPSLYLAEERAAPEEPQPATF